MNSTQWQSHGYKTVFFNSRVYLVRPLSGIVIHTDVNGGDWMRYDNVNKEPWIIEPSGINGLDPKTQKRINHAIENCYCGQCGIDVCDFCACRR